MIESKDLGEENGNEQGVTEETVGGKPAVTDTGDTDDGEKSGQG